MDPATAATLSLVLSIVSVLVAGMSLGWNIYKEIGLKAKVEISLQIMKLVTPGVKVEGEFLVLSATNFGPGIVNLKTVYGRRRSFKNWISGKNKAFLFRWESSQPQFGTLPCKIEVGDELKLFFSMEIARALIEYEINEVGVCDSFGRTHFVPKKQIGELAKNFTEKKMLAGKVNDKMVGENAS